MRDSPAARYVAAGARSAASDTAVVDWARYLDEAMARSALAANDKAAARQKRTKKLFGKVRMQVAMAAAFSSTISGKGAKAAEREERRLAEDEEDERLDTLEEEAEAERLLAEEEAAELARGAAAEAKQQREELRGADAGLLQSDIDALKEEQEVMEAELLETKELTQELAAELEVERELLEAELGHVDDMVQELRRLGDGKVPWPGRLSHSDTALYISLVILYTKYTGWRQNDFNVHA